jgi:hypothetical protein
VLNGRARVVDPATGHANDQCIVAIRVERTAWAKLHLATVDPMRCLETLGARLVKPLSRYAPVAPEA